MSILIFGHKNPDTDSICSTLAYAYLKNELGIECSPRTLGPIKPETRFVLDYFNQDPPEFLENVYTQVSDLNYKYCEGINENNSYVYAYKIMEKNQSNTITVLNANNNITGILTIKDIAMELISGNFFDLDTYFINLINQLEATVIFAPKENFHISGTLVIATDYHKNIKQLYKKDHIVISGDIDSINEELINNEIKLLIICSNSHFPERLVSLAKNKRVPIIQTPLGTYHVSKLIQQCNVVKKIMKKDRIISFNIDERVDEILDDMIASNHRNYPVTDNDGKYLGFINRKHLLEARKKRVILLDHNEYSQSVEGIKEAEILEIIDHHKLGGINTISPINFINSPVGSTCTLIYEEYIKNKIDIPYIQGGLLISGILSDTLMFKSPTCTERDVDAVKQLNQILKLDIEVYFASMFKSASQISHLSAKDIIYSDYKEFNSGNIRFAVSQIFTSDLEHINKIKTDLEETMENIKITSNFNFILLAITDIILEGSYILCTKNFEKIANSILETKEETYGNFAFSIVSRKKQIIPQLIKALDEI
ncbi:MAG: putative manganese-dependent inorganic diphosphatase [Filifactoraceae bacterium]